jgi:hypothetical protein
VIDVNPLIDMNKRRSSNDVNPLIDMNKKKKVVMMFILFLI